MVMVKTETGWEKLIDKNLPKINLLESRDIDWIFDLLGWKNAGRTN